MLENYFKIAIRNLLRQKTFSFINVSGLAAGMACCVLILLFVEYEHSFDDFHSKSDRIFRVNKRVKTETGEIRLTAETPGKLGPTLMNDYAFVKNAVRLNYWFGGMIVAHEDVTLRLADVHFADQSIFEVFDFKLLEGNPETALAEPNSGVITPEAAKQIFGSETAIGKVVRTVWDVPVKITGIIKAPPENSHIQYDMLISWKTTTHGRYANNFTWMNNWITQTASTYIELSPDIEATAFETLFPTFMKEYMERWSEKYFPYLQPLAEVHLHSSDVTRSNDYKPGNILYINMFSLIAFLVLIIAAVNFMNLSTARATKRAKEVGLRRIIGASRKQLIRQFLGESILISTLALGLAIVLVEIALPFFNDLTNRELMLEYGFDKKLPWMMVASSILLGLLSGLYPAFVLSSLTPTSIFNQWTGSGRGSVLMRRLLVIFQFAIAITLVAATTIVSKQTSFMHDKELGFNQEHVLIIPMGETHLSKQLPTFRNTLLTNPDIVNVSASKYGVPESAPPVLISCRKAGLKRSEPAFR